MTNDSVDIAVLLCHPDDELYMGGTLIKHIRMGFEVAIVYVTKGGWGHPFIEEEKLKEMRMEEARRANETFATRPPTFLDFNDGTVPYSDELALAIARELRRLRPKIVISLHYNAKQLDHAHLGLSLIKAIPFIHQPKVECEYPPYSGIEEIYFSPMGEFGQEGMSANVFIDVTEELDTVRKVSANYRTQIEAHAMRWTIPPDGKMPDNISYDEFPNVLPSAERIGKAAGVTYAEALYAYRGAGDFTLPALPIVRSNGVRPSSAAT